MAERRRAVAIVAGLDPGGGAGLIADVQHAVVHGLRPVGVVTAHTEQDTSGVRAVHPVPAEVVGAGLVTLLSDIEVAAVKIGMLGHQEIADAVAEALALTAAPVVWDPVLLPTAGRVALLHGDPARVKRALDPHLTLVTPNLAEAAALTGLPVTTVAEMVVAAPRLVADDDQSALITGGHLSGAAVDVLYHRGRIEELSGPRVDTGGPVHGTGCALSTTIACRLALGDELPAAVRAAKRWVTERLGTPVRAGRGMGAMV